VIKNDLQVAQGYQRAAFKWLELARQADSATQREQLLAVAEAWSQMAHDAFEIEQQTSTVH
jgi:hypothetical protein